jgi:hypothetical protein
VDLQGDGWSEEIEGGMPDENPRPQKKGWK